MKRPIHQVEITGMEIVKNPEPNRGGSTVLAYFNCAVGGFTMFGCVLALTTKGVRRVWPPKGVGMPGNIGSKIRITDKVLLKAMLDAARNAYHEMKPARERNAA